MIFQLFIIFSTVFPSFISANDVSVVHKGKRSRNSKFRDVFHVEYFAYFKNPRGFSRYTKYGTGKMRPLVSFMSWEPRLEISATDKNSKPPTKPTIEKIKKQGLVEEKLSPFTASVPSIDEENKESVVDKEVFSVLSTSEEKKNPKLVEEKASTLQSEKQNHIISVEVDSKTFTTELAQ